MPELPDVEVYCDALNRLYRGRRVERVSLRSPFVVRTVEPELFAIEGGRLAGFRRLGKRIARSGKPCSPTPRQRFRPSPPAAT